LSQQREIVRKLCDFAFYEMVVGKETGTVPWRILKGCVMRGPAMRAPGCGCGCGCG
jgi:hypothetical protein